MLHVRSLGLDLVRVPEGEFRMGADFSAPGVNGEEVPEHAVWLSEYEIMKTPVTMGAVRAYAREQSSSAYAKWMNVAPASVLSLADNHAAVWVSWYDASEFAQWLSQASGDRWDLPTEAQWEKARRGTESRIYPWGNNRLSIAEDTEVRDPGPVAQHPERATPYGCLDMWENVLEWCLDWWSDDRPEQQPGVVRDPKGPTEGEFKMCRGGNSSLGKPECCYRRDSYWEPTTRNSVIGFRLIRIATGT